MLFLSGGTAGAQVVTQNLAALGTTQDLTADAFQFDTDRRYAPQGMQFGPLSVFGGAEEALGYTNNADRLVGGRASALMQTNANLSARLSERSGAAEVGMTVNSLYYPSDGQQNQTNWSGALRGHEERGAHYLSYGYTHRKLSQMSTDLGALALNRPIPYTDDAVDLSDRIRLPGKLVVTSGVHMDRFVFEEVPDLNRLLQQSYRNRFIINENVGLRYSFVESSALLAVLQGTQIRYTTNSFDLPSRDSNGFAGLVGYDYAFPGPFQIRVLGGYQGREYQTQAYRPFGAFYAEMRGVWTPTRMTQLSLTVSRGIADSAFENVVGFIYTTANLHVRHAFSRNIFLNADVGVQAGGAGHVPAIFKNTPLYQENESQQNYLFNISVEKRVSRHLAVDLVNSFQNVNAVGTQRYSIDSVMLNLKYGL